MWTIMTFLHVAYCLCMIKWDVLLYRLHKSTLKKWVKSLWFNFHLRFLPENHIFKRNKNALKKGEWVTNLPPPHLSLSEVWNRVCELPKFIGYRKACTIQGYRDKHNWTKGSIFGTSYIGKITCCDIILLLCKLRRNFFWQLF